MTTFFAPTDLRVVDPRPAVGPSESDESVVRDLLTARLSGDDLTRALRALGLAPYERTVNPAARDAWMRPVREAPKRVAAQSASVCKNNHDRRKHSKLDRRGHWYCVACQTARGEAIRARNAEAAV